MFPQHIKCPYWVIHQQCLLISSLFNPSWFSLLVSVAWNNRALVYCLTLTEWNFFFLVCPARKSYENSNTSTYYGNIHCRCFLNDIRILIAQNQNKKNEWGKSPKVTTPISEFQMYSKHVTNMKYSSKLLYRSAEILLLTHVFPLCAPHDGSSVW